MKNKFIQSLFSYDSQTENGALSHSTSGSSLLDYFSKSGTYRDRPLDQVFADMSLMWAESPKRMLEIVFYNRMITRTVVGTVETEQVQKGQGNRSEFRRAMIWLVQHQPAIFYKNMWLIPLVGTWKDLWHQEVIESLDWTKVYPLIALGLKDNYNKHLLAKYLPRIRSKANTHNERHLVLNKFAFGLIKHLGWSPKEYRKFKASGKAHVFQQQLCAQAYDKIQFEKIPGKALFQMVTNVGKDSQTTLQRHEMEDRYLGWIKEQPTAKFTGYVYELMSKVSTKMTAAQRHTLDKQFEGLIELAKADQRITENVWCALDTSGSMLAPVANTSAFDICISLGIYFSTLNEGTFKDHVVMFSNESKVKKLSGSFTDKVLQIMSDNMAWGSTNFQSVIEEIVRVRTQHPEIPVSDFPTTLVVVSDMQFNPVEGNTQTNYEAAMRLLASVGLPKIRIVWWWVTGRGQDLPNKLDNEGLIMIGGFDGAILAQLLGEDPPEAEPGKRQIKITPYEAMEKVLDQEVLKLIEM